MVLPSPAQEAEHAAPAEPAELKIDPGKTALLLLHWQNEIVKPEGKMSGNFDFPQRLAAAHTIEHTKAVLEASRKKNMLIIYVTVSFRPGYPEGSKKNPGPQLTRLIKAQACLAGTWGAEVIDELKPLENEIVINNHSANAFAYTVLDPVLRNHGITSVVLTGLVTNWVVESTGRDARNRGYSVYTLSDCCNSWSDEAHNWPLKNILPVLGAVCDSKSYIEALEKAK